MQPNSSTIGQRVSSVNCHLSPGLNVFVRGIIEQGVPKLTSDCPGQIEI